MVGTVSWTTTLALFAVSTEGHAQSPAPEGSAVAVLWVGVLRDAGTVFDVASDGASGQCVVAAESIQCPARLGPVAFRYAGDGPYVLTDGTSEGVVEVQAGQRVSAWVLPPDDARVAERARLAPGVVTEQDVTALFVRTGDHEPLPPSYGQLRDLVALVDHPDVRVRRVLPDALLPWWRHTASDPIPLGAPAIVPEGLVLTLAGDHDVIVRKRLASRLRDLREPGQSQEREANEVLSALATEGGGVQRAALGSLATRSREEAAPPMQTWTLAMAGITEPGARGRAAATALSALKDTIELGPDVDPTEAVELCLTHHPEKTWSLWNAWREEVPFDLDRATRLVRGTVGWSPSLLRHWARTDPAGLADLLVGWEPASPHSDRWSAMVRGLGPVEDPRLGSLVEHADNLSRVTAPEPGR
ncbi:MAG: hypothetical protein H6735_12520 [Alphaproteobacteria bacterium]|nr:hypothetical protein [Alphaproteobacteria bacterium]